MIHPTTMAASSAITAFLFSFLLQARAFVPIWSPVQGSNTNMNKRGLVGARGTACHQLAYGRSLKASSIPVDDSGDGGATPTVLCHGEILFDCIAKPEAAGWDLERVVEEVAWTPYPGGALANVACALSKLGVSACFVGAVGKDELGDELLWTLETSGVGTQLATKIDHWPTRTVMVTRDMSGDRTFGGFGDGKPSDSFADCHHRLIDAKDEVMRFLGKGTWLVQGTLGLAYPDSMESHVCLAEWAKEAGAIRYLDINWRPVFWELAAGGAGSDFEALARERITAFARSADVVKLTDEEAAWLCGVSGEEALRDPSLVSTFFPSAKVILVTAGEKGAAYAIGGRTGFVPCFEDLEVVETTGAGDAFSAGFIAQAIKLSSPSGSRSGSSLEASFSEGEADGSMAHDVVRFASAVGALTCCGEGAIAPQPTEEEVRRLLLSGGVRAADLKL